MEYLKHQEQADLESNKYSREYERLHIGTLEHKINEKDRLLLELSAINQEIYQEMHDLQQRLSISKSERDNILQENLSLKDTIMEKNTVITQQEALISRLRNQISELTNGHSQSLEEKQKSPSTSMFIFSELKVLQNKYDSREDLIISLQDERIKLLSEIDRLRVKMNIEPLRRSYY